MEKHLVRYIISSKDRTAPGPLPVVNPVVAYVVDSPADFGVLLNPPIDANVSEFWIKLQNIAIPSIPVSTNKSYIGQGRYALDTLAFIDLCIDYQQSQAVDTNTGIAEKMGNDNTFALIPYDAQNTEGIVRLYTDQPWVRVRNNGQHQSLRVKLFADTGLQLATRLLTGDVITSVPTTAAGAVQCTAVSPSTTPAYYQQLTFTFASLPAVTRGDIVSGGTIVNYIFGVITVISIDSTAKTVTVGFPRQLISNGVGAGRSFFFSSNSKKPGPLQDWTMELLVSTTDPGRDRIL